MPKFSDDPHGGWAQLPLPGTHDCLTWQLNVTLHPRGDAAKWTSVLRDPNVQIELARVGSPLIDLIPSVERLMLHVPAVVGQLWYLAGLPTDALPTLGVQPPPK